MPPATRDGTKENAPRDTGASPYGKAPVHATNASPAPLARHLQTTTGAAPAAPSPKREARTDPAAAALSRTSWRSQNAAEMLQPWERDVVQSPEVQRKATLAQIYFLNHYFDSLRYLADRRERLAQFEAGMREQGYVSPEQQVEQSLAGLRLGDAPRAAPASRVSDDAYRRARQEHFAREREILLHRRAKLRLAQFHIVTQVGQGGYGEVFLARKRDTGELCALKRLRKRVLIKMDEVRHVLTERDILTATRTPWLVRLLYAFQDESHVYLAMVRGPLTPRNTSPAATSVRCSTTAACCAKSTRASIFPRCSSR